MRMSHLRQKRQQHPPHRRKNQTNTPPLLIARPPCLAPTTATPSIQVSIHHAAAALVLGIQCDVVQHVVFLHCVHGYVSRCGKRGG